ncbi:hypothetical protein I3700191H1_13660 [Megasphaera massiliensis]
MIAWILIGIIGFGVLNIIDTRTLIENIRILVSYVMFLTVLHAAATYSDREYKQTVMYLIGVIVCIVVIALSF